MIKWGMKVGGQVDIKRSDGRVHPAVVSGFNDSTRSVTVEWFENQETKGKELDLHHLAALNPAVFDALKKGGNKGDDKPAPSTDGGSSSSGTDASAKVAQRRPTRAVKATAGRKKHLPAVGQSSSAAANVTESKDEDVDRKKSGGSSSTTSSGGGGKGKVFNNIQEIAAKREARRANHEKQAKKNEVDKAAKANNPNWEFAVMVDDYRSTKHIVQGIPPGMQASDRKITVCVRKRPLNRGERNRCDVDVTTIPDGENLLLHECKNKVDLTRYLEHHHFRFDQAFDESVDNATVYKYSAAPLVRTIFEKGMATCFAYGQTGSGKTHTMLGEYKEGTNTPDSTGGVYAMAAADVFRYNEQPEYKAKGLAVSVSFFEIYAGKVFDLLNGQKRLRVLEDGKQQVNIVGLAEQPVSNIRDVFELLKIGTDMRASGTTSANQNSSRSHAVFQIVLRTRKNKKVHGKFSLIDLAGNERGADTSSANRQTRMEGAEINKSLLALKECIRALSMKSKHTPYRASKLTQVLRDSFIGNNARTCMIAMVSPGLESCENSLNTLRYADRVKELKKDKAILTDAGGGAGGAGSGGVATASKASGGRRPAGKTRSSAEPAAPVAATAPDSSNTDAALEMDDAEDGDWLLEPSPLESSLARQDLKRLHESLKIKDRDHNNNLFNFHNAVAEVVEAEERLEEEHRATIQLEREMLDEEDRLLQDINGVDYDVEDYAQRLDQILDTKIKRLTELSTSVRSFRKQLQDEEQASKQVPKGAMGDEF
eukprot:m.1325256 g.1325256  ORF g.1325256 m.1325256 type:complete len:767 (-) comp24853_c0_seq26:4199-6499(-)